jgi:tRNA (guanine37-N1)-methyltransferase
MTDPVENLRIGMISLLPFMFDALHYGVIGRALEEKRLAIEHFNPRDFTTDPYKRVDDRPYGGGPGMVMSYQPLADAIAAAKAQLPLARVIHLSPQGQPLNHAKVKQLSEKSELILVASRYEGVDQRLIDSHIDEELSVGDFVVSGGELPAMLLIDAIGRCLPGVLGDPQSANEDSFVDGLLDHPHYTRPEIIAEIPVPKVLLSGDHAAIAHWRKEQRQKSTWQRRPDLLKRCSPKTSENVSDRHPTPLSEKEDNDEK